MQKVIFFYFGETNFINIQKQAYFRDYFTLANTLVICLIIIEIRPISDLNKGYWEIY